MKKQLFIFLVVYLFLIVKLQAQDYQISFGGIGASTTVESVQVQNLTKGTSLTISGSDVLHLTTGTSAIKTVSVSDKLIQIYQDPITSDCNIAFEASNAGPVSVDLFDMAGKKINSVQNNLPSGIHTYNVKGLNKGVYIFTITTKNGIFSSKYISNCKNAGTATINYINCSETSANFKNSIQESSEITQFRSAQTMVDMPYTNGDRILLKGISGNYSTLISLVPTANSTQIFNFVAATDYEGNNYTTVTIGKQVWMVENLKVTKYNDGTEIPNVTENSDWANCSTGAYCTYNNSTAKGTKYGNLYNWKAVNSGKLSPAGWHVPNDVEWTTLKNYLITNGYNYDRASYGNKIAKSLAATTDWATTTMTGVIGKNLTLNNSSGFSALPGGSRNSLGSFAGSEFYGTWWSSTEEPADDAYPYILDFVSVDLSNSLDNKQYGFSVRCIKN